VAAVQDDVGRELVEGGQAVELTREEFEERLTADLTRPPAMAYLVGAKTRAAKPVT
jgi:hypothetical protein